MGYFILILLFLIFFFYSISKPTNALAMLVILALTLKFIYINLFNTVTGATGPFMVLLVLSLLFPVFTVITRIKDKDVVRMFRAFIITIIFGFFYFYTSASAKGVPEGQYLSFIRFHYIAIPVFIFMSINYNKIDFIKLMKFIFILFLIEFFIALAQNILPQNMTGFFRVGSYVWNNQVTYVTSEGMWGGLQINGTLLHVGNFANFMALFLVFFIGLYLFRIFKPIKKRITFLFYLMATFAIILSTGNRTSVVSLLAGFLIILYFHSKRYFSFAIAFIIPLLIVSSIFFDRYVGTQSAYDIGYDNPLERLSILGNLFTNVNELTEEESLTLGRSFPLWEYFLKNPVFGAGEFFKGGYTKDLYAGTTTASWSDASLMFHIVEFGLVGLVILLMPYFIILKYIKKRCTKQAFILGIALFFTLLIQTITDLGFFNILQSIVFVILLGAVAFAKPFQKRVNELSIVHPDPLVRTAEGTAPVS